MLRRAVQIRRERNRALANEEARRLLPKPLNPDAVKASAEERMAKHDALLAVKLGLADG